MSTIVVDDQTREGLESQAKARGLELAEYLRLIARANAPVPTPPEDESLADLVGPILDAGSKRSPQPVTRETQKETGFGDDLVRKYRQMGFRL